MRLPIFAAVIVAIVVGIPIDGVAAPPPTTTPSYRGFDDVERVYKARVAAGERDYVIELRRAREDRLAALRGLQDRAMQAQDIDVAVQLREKITAAEDELNALPIMPIKPNPDADRIALENRLKGSLWSWGNDEYIRFEPNGTASNGVWTAMELVTRWKVIDRRTVLLYIESGRKFDRYAILTFSSNADSYSGYSFDGTMLPTNRQTAK